MTIQFECSCGKQYRVKDELAGKKAKCSNCGNSITVPPQTTSTESAQSKPVTKVPQITTGSSSRQASEVGNGFPHIDTGRPKVHAEVPQIATGRQPQINTSAQAQPSAEQSAGSDNWHLYSHDGNQYGPISKSDLDRWLNEGLITAECQIFQEGAADWQPATDFFPQLLPAGHASPSLPAAQVQTKQQHAGNRQIGADYQPLLTASGKKKSMANMAINGELKKMPGVQLISSDQYHVGEPRTFLESLKAGTMIGPIKFSEMSIDLMQLFRFRDALGEFAMVLPFDNGMIAPCEYVAIMTGCLPSAMVLLKQSGGKVALEAGILAGGPLGAALQRVGTKVESIWAGCDGSVPPVAEAAQRIPQLSQGINWDGKVGGGPVSVVYRLSWGVQAIPLNDKNYLLVAQSIPKQKMIGFNFGISWFCDYRQQFSKFVASQNAAECGDFDFLDPGVWLSSALEVLDWVQT